MVYCQNSQSQTKAVTLVFKREELLYDAENYSFVEGDIMQAEDEHARHQVFDIRVRTVMWTELREYLDLAHSEAWEPDCKAYAPLNVYGQTKLGGELAVAQTLEKYFIVRIAWVFGLNGKNFIKTMLKVAKNHPQVRVVNDQIGTPTYTYDLAIRN